MNAASVWDSLNRSVREKLLTHHYWKYHNLRSLWVKFPKIGMDLHYASCMEKGIQLSKKKKKKVGNPWYLLWKRYVLGSEIVIKSKNSSTYLVCSFFPRTLGILIFFQSGYAWFCLIIHITLTWHLLESTLEHLVLQEDCRCWLLSPLSLVEQP